MRIVQPRRQFKQHNKKWRWKRNLFCHCNCFVGKNDEWKEKDGIVNSRTEAVLKLCIIPNQERTKDISRPSQTKSNRIESFAWSCHLNGIIRHNCHCVFVCARSVLCLFHLRHSGYCGSSALTAYFLLVLSNFACGLLWLFTEHTHTQRLCGVNWATGEQLIYGKFEMSFA